MVHRLFEAVARERERLFVGRERELGAIEQWLDDPAAHTTVISVTGMGGVGKSTFLYRVHEIARSRGVASIWVDGRACGRTPSGFLAYLEAVLGPDRRLPRHTAYADTVFRDVADGDVAFRDTVYRDAVYRDAIYRETAYREAAYPGAAYRSPAYLDFEPQERVVWCIDNFEELEPIDGWLRERFFASFPTLGQLVVVASRQDLLLRWRDDRAWNRRVLHFPLEPFTRSESRSYLERVGIADAAIDILVRRTAGLPLALSLAADALDRHPEAIGPGEEDLLLTVNARLLWEAAGDELQPLIDLLTVVPDVDSGLISEVLGERPSAVRLASLARLSFVHASHRGFRLHDVARQYLAAELRERDIDHFRRLRRMAVSALLRRLQLASPHEAVSIASTLLETCCDALPAAENYADPSALRPLAVRTPLVDDLPDLHRLLARAGETQPFVLTQPGGHHRLLDRMVREFPEACRAVCAPEGKILGFLVTPLLWRGTAACIEEIEPGALARHFPKEHERFAALAPEEADTYVAVAIGILWEHPDYAFWEIIGALIRDGLARLGAGTRALLGGTRPELRQILTRLGFREYADGPEELSHEGTVYTLYELDLRQGRFGSWVMSLLRAAEGEDSPDTGQFNSDDLRELIAGLQDPEVWKRSKVASSLGLEPEALMAMLKDVLIHEKPLPPPFDDQDRKLLVHTFVNGLASSVIADRMHISRATYYRYLDRALDHLRESLIHAARRLE